MLGVMLGVTAGLAAASAAPAAPLWTATPTPVDRSRETRERLPSALDRGDLGDADTVTVRVDRHPQLDEAGSFRGEGRRWTITDVAIPSPSWLCKTADGARWACGVRLRARYSRSLQGARLVCGRTVSDVAAGRLADCRIKGVAVGATMAALEEALRESLAAGRP